MSQHTASQAGKRFRAKVANHGFRGAYWQKGDIVEVGPEEEKVITHHFEELGKADDGSADEDLREKLVEQEKLDNLKDIKVKASYDRVQPEVAGGVAAAIEKTPEQKTQDALDRKAEEVENDKRHEEDRKNPRRRSFVSPDDAAVIARVAEQNRESVETKHSKK